MVWQVQLQANLTESVKNQFQHAIVMNPERLKVVGRHHKCSFSPLFAELNDVDPFRRDGSEDALEEEELKPCSQHLEYATD